MKLNVANGFFSKFTELGVLVFAGECVFLLPFVLSRIFRSTFLKVFEITNFQLGSAFSVYGVVAMLSYFFGGSLADRFSSKKLMSISLFLTGSMGFVLVLIPSITMLTILYGCFGLSTIFLFWAAFTKSTRVIGGKNNQGKSFGMVDAGRGLLAALLASGSVYLFDLSLVEADIESPSLNQLKLALSNIIVLFSCLTLAGSLLVWFFIPDDQDLQQRSINKSSHSLLKPILEVSRKKAVWWQAIIILCSYVGYKCTDDFSLFASDALNYNDVEAARLGTVSFWVRPLSAITAGLLADRFKSSKMLMLYFFLMAVGSFGLGFGTKYLNWGFFFLFNVVVSSIGIYGLRGLYFTLFEEAKIPLNLTGSATGLVSVIGFSPDIFMGPLMGFLTDRGDGAEGHQQLFLIVSAFALLGLVATFNFQKNQAGQKLPRLTDLT